MLTTSPAPNVSFTSVSSQAETTGSGWGECVPGPEELRRRILEVRASWDPSERLARRREAQRRFENLVETLCGGRAA